MNNSFFFLKKSWQAVLGFTKSPEFYLILIFIPPLFVGRFFSGEYALPGFGGSIFVLNHYAVPVLIGIFVSFAFLGRIDIGGAINILILCIFSVFVHFNFKCWAPLINPNNYDVQLHELDKYMGVADWASSARGSIAEIAGSNIDMAYHDLFVAMFFLCFAMCVVKGKIEAARRVNYAMCFVLLLGGMMYWVFPAAGPFVFGQTAGGEAVKAQSFMYPIYNNVRKYADLPDGYFIEALAAMPSLHLAHATVFLCFSLKYVRWASIIFFFSLVWFFIESMAAGWHYFIDIPPGIVLGIFSSVAAFKCIKDE